MEEALVCPETRRPLRLVRRADAAGLVGGVTFGPTETLLLREDGERAYPVVDGAPVLLVPEALEREPPQADLTDPRYAEAYEEMEHYNDTATTAAVDITSTVGYRAVSTIRSRDTFPHPLEEWLVDTVYDCAAGRDAFLHLAPLEGKRTLQIGGSGTHAVKFLLAGAAEAWLVTPMLGEAKLARSLAEAFGVSNGFREVLGVAEELPFPDGAFDAVYAGGAIHHTVTDLALPEIARILRPGGRFAAVDPWRAPLYGIGTRVFGKREKDVHCRPLTSARVASFAEAFGHAEVRQHGPVTRYPMLALLKLGFEVTTPTMWRLNRIDEAAMRIVPRLRRTGGSAVLLGTR